MGFDDNYAGRHVAAINAAEIGSYVNVDVPFPGDPAS